MKKIYLLLIFAFVGNYGFSQTVCEELFNDGKKAFDKGEYQEAIKKFEQGLNRNCDNANFKDWINKSKEQLKKKTVDTPRPSSPCSALIQKGKRMFDSKNYEGAKTLFISAKELGCTESDDWIRKIEKIEKDALCQNAMDKGGFHYDREEYEMALTYFEFAKNNGCFGSDLWIQRCKNRIVVTVPLDLTDIRRAINTRASSYPTQSFDNGDYIGEVYGVQRNGLGIYTWADGAIYIGEFQKDHRSGIGIYIVSDGYFVSNCVNAILYVGEWENDRRKGLGFCYDETGALIYHGKFANNIPAENYPSTGNDTSYKLEMVKYATGECKYFGQTKGGVPHGQGLYLWESGDMWYGSWKDGIRAGSGIFISKTGEITSGYWVGDEYRVSK